MESAGKKVNSEIALEQARAWKLHKATLSLSISGEPEKRVICDKLWGYLDYVPDDGGSLEFKWEKKEFEEKVPAFVDGAGRFVIWLADASFSMLNIPQKSMTIVRGSYQYILTEVRASAIG